MLTGYPLVIKMATTITATRERFHQSSHLVGDEQDGV